MLVNKFVVPVNDEMIFVMISIFYKLINFKIQVRAFQ